MRICGFNVNTLKKALCMAKTILNDISEYPDQVSNDFAKDWFIEDSLLID